MGDFFLVLSPTVADVFWAFVDGFVLVIGGHKGTLL